MNIKILLIIFFFGIVASPVLAQELMRVNTNVVGEIPVEVIGEVEPMLIQEEFPVDVLVAHFESSEKNMEKLRKAKAQKQILQKIVEDKSGKKFQNEVANEYRSVVAEFVQSLNSFADKQEGIGEQVRAVAKAQADVEDKVGPLLDSIKSKNKVRKFFFGTNFLETKEIKKEIRSARKNLAELEFIKEGLNDFSDWEILDFETNKLNTIINNVLKEVETEEGRFSLFGWVKKIFI